MRCELDTKDGGVCLNTLLSDGDCPNWANHAPGTSWTFDSALWQIVHGERNTDKTNNASDCLHELVESPDCMGILDKTEQESILNLIGAISDLRDVIDRQQDTIDQLDPDHHGTE